MSNDLKNTLRGLPRPALFIGAAAAVVVLVAILAAVTGGTNKAVPVPAPTAAKAAAAAVVPAAAPVQPVTVALVAANTAPAASAPAPAAPMAIQYRAALPPGTAVHPGFHVLAKYAGAAGSQLSTIFEGDLRFDQLAVSTDLDVIKRIAIPTQNAKLQIVTTAYFSAPAAGDFTFAVIHACGSYSCGIVVSLDDATMSPVFTGESSAQYAGRLVETPYTTNFYLQPGYHKVTLTQTIAMTSIQNKSNARVLLKGPSDAGLLDVLAFMPG
jgi:hypothetical protein